MAETKTVSGTKCWNSIGVWGSQHPKCEKLERVIHCRNCNVYWDAGRTVFEKHIPSRYVEEWTANVAKIKEQISPQSKSILYFRIAEEWFSLSTKAFIEVSEQKRIHSIPHQSGNLILGVINVGGAVKVCFSLGYVMGVNSPGDHSVPGRTGIYSRLILIRSGKSEFVFPVDEIGGVYRYDPDELKQVPATIEASKANLLLGILRIEKKEVACINIDALASIIEGMIGG